MNRRSLLLGLGATLAAPAIVKAENLMKIAAVRRSRLSWAGYEFSHEQPALCVWMPPSSCMVDLNEANLEHALISIRSYIRLLRDSDALLSYSIPPAT